MTKKKIKDICVVNFATLKSSDNICKIEYLDTSSITNNIIESVQQLEYDSAPSRAQRKVKNNTIVYSTVRPNLKHYGIIKNPPENFIVSTGFCTIDIKDSTSYCADYLYYLISQQLVTDYLHTIAQNAVSAYPSINPSDIENLSFDFPDINKQVQISSILSNIEQKITLNSAINQNLPSLDRSSKEAVIRLAA